MQEEESVPRYEKIHEVTLPLIDQSASFTPVRGTKQAGSLFPASSRKVSSVFHQSIPSREEIHSNL